MQKYTSRKKSSGVFLDPDKFDSILKRWGHQANPIRKLVLMGWDQKHSPCFIILFGIHGFKTNQVDITEADIYEFNKELELKGLSPHKREISPGTYKVLRDRVGYNGYVVLRGSHGHFPNLKNLSLGRDSSYNYYRRRYSYSKRYVTELKWRYGRGKYRPRRYGDLIDCIGVTLPYFENISYEEQVELLKNAGFRPSSIELVKSPNDVFHLGEELQEYLDLLFNIVTSTKLYQRKKCLNELIELNPPKGIYLKILDIGNPELICGLLLQLAKSKNPIVKAEVEDMTSSLDSWLANKNQRNGVIRCAEIYKIALDSKLKQDRINTIRDDIKDLVLVPIYAKRPKRARWLKKKESRVSFKDYVDSWHQAEWEYMGPTLRFRANKFTDGTKLKHIFFKNILQEAYLYDLPEVLGKIAYFADTPEFQYLLKNSGNVGTRIYFERYIRRIIDEYSRSNEKGFLEILKHFFSSYNTSEIISLQKFNYILNYLIEIPRKRERTRSHRYYYFRERRSSSEITSKNFKLERQIQNYDFRTSIYRRNIDKILEILTVSTNYRIQNFFFKIVREAPDLEKLISKLPTKVLITLSLLNNGQISRFFKAKLIERIESSDEFNPEVMLALMECSNEELQSRAWKYFNRVKGTFEPDTIAQILWLDNVNVWSALISNNINNFNGNQYFDFVTSLMNECLNKETKRIELADDIVELLMSSNSKINDITTIKMEELVENCLDVLSHEPNISNWLGKFIQNLICSIDLKNLISLLKKLKIKGGIEPAAQYAQNLLSILKAVKHDSLPSDKEIMDLISFGSPSAVSKLVNVLHNKKELLTERNTTLLLLFESDLVPIHELASTVFKAMPETKRDQFLSVLIDSPVKKAYLYALNTLDEIFNDKIPKNLIVQMLEHSSHEVKAYISDKIDYIINEIGNGNQNAELFMYYFKTLVLLPNLHSKSKTKLHQAIIPFAVNNKNFLEEIQSLLLELGGSNVIKDSERALVALAKINMEVGKVAA